MRRLATPEMKLEPILFTQEHCHVSNRKRADQPLADGFEHMIKISLRTQLARELDQRSTIIVLVFVENIAIKLYTNPILNWLKNKRRDENQGDNRARTQVIDTAEGEEQNIEYGQHSDRR